MLNFTDPLFIGTFFDVLVLSVASSKRLPVGVYGLKILTSKKALSYWPPQKALAATSNLVPSSVMAEEQARVSPVSG